MLEYASVTASAYDVDSLVGKLNAHASQGWEVTSVVAAGGDVVAIMHRVRSSDDAAEAVAADETPAMAAVATDQFAEEAAPVIDEAPAFSEAASSVAEVAAPAAESSSLLESVTDAAPSSASDAASSAADHARDAFGASEAGAGIAGAAAGVGVGSIFGNDAPADDVAIPAADVTPAVEAVAPVVETVAPVVAEVPAAVEPSGWGSAQTTVGTPVAPTPAPAPVVTTPAGWYPDPSGRFEMRYWDGSAWTEHVSRQGQQFTDPPVA
jgi:Protein of unknown function (DUF2510)